jgi:hypothetical protein
MPTHEGTPVYLILMAQKQTSFPAADVIRGDAVKG